MKRFMLIAAITLLVGCQGTVTPERAEGDSDAPPAAPETETVDETEAPGRPVAFRDGKHLVGSDIQAGTYRATPSGSCYWARLSGVGGGVEDGIANENATGSAVVTIAASDEAFESIRCGEWTADLGPVTESRTIFGEGTMIVGTDIDPGRYRNDGTGSCYWARLRDFSGEMSGLIANENADGSTLVEIAASDVGFQSTRCGTWSRV